MKRSLDENAKDAIGFSIEIRPLALRLKPQESTQFFKGNFDIPTPGSPQDDLHGRYFWI